MNACITIVIGITNVCCVLFNTVETALLNLDLKNPANMGHLCGVRVDLWNHFHTDLESTVCLHF